tara:strand:- start:6111 stop:6875 length:765 start_codon:yes stop_codon:yes gene_type:complete
MATESKCQTNISAIEENLVELFKHDNEGRIFRNKEEPPNGNTTNLHFSTTSRRNKITDGIYLITVYPSGSSSHAILLLISQNGTKFDLFEPNGKKWANNPDFYTLNVFIGNKNQKINTDLSPIFSLNSSESCGIWGIVISILLNKVAIGELLEEDKMFFYQFLNKSKETGEVFIATIKKKFFVTGKGNYESISNVSKLVENIKTLIVEKINEEKNKNTRGAEQLGGNKKKRNKKTNKKKRNKKRSKTNKKKIKN